MAFGKVQIFIVYRCKVVFNRGSRKLTDYFMVVSWLDKWLRNHLRKK